MNKPGDHVSKESPMQARVVEWKRAIMFSLDLLENLCRLEKADGPAPPQSGLYYSEALEGHVRAGAVTREDEKNDVEGDASLSLAIASASKGRTVFYASLSEPLCRKMIRHFCHTAGVRESQAPKIGQMGFGPVTRITNAANRLAKLPVYWAHPSGLSLAELERLTETAVRDHGVTMLIVDERKRDVLKSHREDIKKLPPKLRGLLELPPARGRDDEIDGEILRGKVELIARRLKISEVAVFV